MTAFLSVTTGLTYVMADLIAEKVRDGIEKVNLGSSPIRSGENVAVKINIPVPLPSENAACSHPVVVAAVIDELKRIGAKATLYEDCYNPKACEISGILEVARAAGVEFVNLNGRPYREVKVGENSYKYYKEILTADHLVSIPKLKTHVFTNYTGAVKNMYGCIQKGQRKSLHKHIEVEDFSRVLVDIYSIKPPSLVVMDGIVGMEGTGPTHGVPKNSGLLMVSNDGIVVDYYASGIMGYNPMQINTNRIAKERADPEYSMDNIELIGEDPKGICFDFKLIPILSGTMKQRFLKMSRGKLLIRKESCANCGICVQSCPFEAIDAGEYPVINHVKCKLCYCCLELCPNEAVISDKSLKFDV